MLIVPDVHGREFWIEPLSKYPDEEVIFLGDYIDPYPSEGITPEDALVVFRKIIKLKKENPSRITLLLGNHDLSYLDPAHKENCCRYDWKHSEEISYLYLEALREDPEFFLLAKEYEGYIFSHAGIHPDWIARHPEFKEDTVRKLNSSLWEKSTQEALAELGSFRGGWEYYTGSPVWSDVREWVGEDIKENDKIQIFGHTQLVEGKIIEGESFKCIDCKNVFRIDENNNFTRL